MDKSKKYVELVHGKDSTELSEMRTQIFDYLLGLGADPNVVLTLSAIDIELATRDVKKGLGLS